MLYLLKIVTHCSSSLPKDSTNNILSTHIITSPLTDDTTYICIQVKAMIM